MSKPIRIQRKRTRGWRMPHNTVCVDRNSRFGNPYFIHQVLGKWEVWNNGKRIFGPYEHKRQAAAKAVELYLQYINTTSLRGEGNQAGTFAKKIVNKDDVRKHLVGKNLACWCSLDEPCHADVLLRLANGEASS